jgi:hypothetical protein
MFEALAAPIADALAKLAKKEACTFLEKVLTNAHAARSATERLRSKYETQVQPAIYEHVAANFYLSAQDFIN